MYPNYLQIPFFLPESSPVLRHPKQQQYFHSTSGTSAC
jgi:hypothetical protein